MPKTVVKRKGGVNGKSGHDGTSRRGRYARVTAAAVLPEVPLVVTPESASRARVSTPSSLEPLSSQLNTHQTANLSTAFNAESSVSITKSTHEAASRARVSTPSSLEPSHRKLSSQLNTQTANLSTAFNAESSASITKSTSSGVKKSAEHIDFCDSADVKRECLKYTKTADGLPSDQQTQISFLLRKFNQSAISTAFSMLIGKVAGSAPMAFLPLPSKKKDLIEQFLCLICDTKSMMINTELECYRYVKKYSYCEYFIFCYLPCLMIKYSYYEYFIITTKML
jgi:hypothetical protein